MSFAMGDFIMKKFPGAKFVELHGDDHFLAAGDVDVMFDNLASSLPLVSSGALRLIAVARLSSR